MKAVKQVFALMLFFSVIISCSREDARSLIPAPKIPLPPLPQPPPSSVVCENRPVINAALVPVGNLSSARITVQCATAGNKILFIGGSHEGPNWWNDPVPVDIFDISSNTWSAQFLVPENSQLSHFRFGAGVASVGNKIFIAGGGDVMGDNQTSKVDIYDAETNSWSIQHLSVPRQGLAAATVGDKVLFAGGFGYPSGSSSWGYFNTVDIYDNSTNNWSIATLSEARMELSATTSGSKIYFAGGKNGSGGNIVSKTIDIYNAATDSWSVSSLKYPRVNMASIAVEDEVYWAGGSLNNVEILETRTGITLEACLPGRKNFTAVKKDDKIVFFTGNSRDPGSGTEFDIYCTTDKTWSVGKIDRKLFNTAVISVDNTIYIAGGTDGNRYSNKVWKLEF